MRLLTQLVAARTARVARRAVATFAALALAGISVDAACRCPMKVTPCDDGACCRSAVAESAARIQASTCGSTCLKAPSNNAVGEAAAAPDRSAPLVHLVSVAAVRATVSTRAPAVLVDNPSLVLSGSHLILRI
jgi:hypothetical protein